MGVGWELRSLLKLALHLLLDNVARRYSREPERHQQKYELMNDDRVD